MKWRKLGRVYCPTGEKEWMRTHAANPVADWIGGDVFRIYFSSRDSNNRSSVAWVEIDLRTPEKVLRVAEEPVLTPGTVGSFDDSGCSLGAIVREGRQLLMYYLGWNLCVTVPWRNSIGLAVSNDHGGHFERVSIAPIVDRSEVDPYSISYPWVLHEAGEWRMWYGSILQWGANPQSEFVVMIKHATSDDGRNWLRDGKVVLQPSSATEYAFARPCVVRDGDMYRMWYSYRGQAFRIGYAESRDGTSWIRRDTEVGIEPSPGEWDGESIEYPSIFDHQGRRYMLYNGNSYGRTGFGIAILESH